MSEHAEIAAALVAALADLTVVEKGRKAKIKTKNGPDYEYEYAAIADVVRETRPVLAKHRLVALTPIHGHGNGLACTVTLLHSSGQRLDFGPFPFPEGRDAQATGSAITYHRRYALVAALGMAAGDDDDGAHASAVPTARESIEDSEPLVTTKQASDRLNERLAKRVAPEELAQHGKTVWDKAALRVIGNGRVPASEVDRLLRLADEYLAEMLEIQGEAKDEQMQASLDAIVHEAEMDKAGDR